MRRKLTLGAPVMVRVEEMLEASMQAKNVVMEIFVIFQACENKRGFVLGSKGLAKYYDGCLEFSSHTISF